MAFLFCMIYPIDVFAEMPRPDLITSQTYTTSNNDNEQSKSDRPAVVQNKRSPRGVTSAPVYTRPQSQNVTTTSHYSNHNAHPSTVHRVTVNTPHYSTHSYSHHTTQYVVSKPVHYTYRPHCRSCYTSAVTYNEPTYETHSTYNVSEIDYDNVYKFGFGIRGIILTNSSIGNVSNDLSGGIGFYLKYRPVRFFSVEFMNDYIFGSYKYDYGDSQPYTKVPLILGTRFHVFDYGSFDAYAALSASISVWNYLDDYTYYKENKYLDSKGVQFGGQFGVGLGYVSEPYEISFDARYTIETVPSFIPNYSKYSDEYQIIHGALFTLNIGFVL